MPIFKCKMCGGQLNIADDCKIVECEYCGSTQTLPSFDNEKKSNLFNRANNLRLNKEFDKAAGVYESIVAEFPDEAEAYWGLCLCKFGIEYVDDPTTGKKVPTCHRTCTTSIMNDNDFELTSENADIVSKKVYREEAKAIDCIQKRILEVVAKEEPYDVFICYKETDDVTYTRTEDSSIAQDIYTELVKEGYRVFFSRVSLREKAGTEYEPYIYSALSSAKVMLAIGTKYEYYDAVWVKNEWSRFLGMMANDSSKVLIPCYKNLDAYDIPKQFVNLQALNMEDVTFYKSLANNIQKAIPKKQNASSSYVSNSINPNTSNGETSALLKRMFIFLEDKDWDRANEYANRILDIDPDCAEAYLGLALFEEKIQSVETLVLDNKVENKNYQKARKYAKGIFLARLKELEERRRYKLESLRTAREKATKYQSIISTYQDQIVGLRSTGSVISTDYHPRPNVWIFQRPDVLDYTGYNNVYDWSDIVAVSVGFFHTVGLKSDGTVVATKFIGNASHNERCNVAEWKDIIAVAAGSSHTIGLKSDGTVVTAGRTSVSIGHISVMHTGQCLVKEWEDIAAISTSSGHTVGLKSDGTVIATKYIGGDYHGQCDVSGWKDIIAVSAGPTHTVGLKSNGTVVATKYLSDNNDYEGQCDVSEWKDIIAIAASGRHTVGLKSDGTVISTASKDQCDIQNWNLFDTSNNSPMNALQEEKKNKELQLIQQQNETNRKLDEEIELKRKKAEKEAEEKRKKAEEKLQQIRAEEERAKEVQLQKEMEQKIIIEKRRSQGLCLHCGGTFKGFFSKKCSQCGKHKDY